jgi:hypothetical protein
MSTLLVELKELKSNGEIRGEILTQKFELQNEVITFRREFEAMGMKRHFLLHIIPQTGGTTVCISQGAPQTQFPKSLAAAICHVTMCIPEDNNATVTCRDGNVMYYVLLYRID